MKKKICTLLIFTLVLSVLCVRAQNTLPFTDIPSDHWAYDAVSYFYAAEVINGMNETTYAPDENVTREQLAKMLSVIFVKNDAAGTQTFSDVPKDRWSYPYIESVKDYLTGYFPAGGTPFFNPGAKAVREDIAYALVRISGYGESDAAVLEAFSDASSVSPKLAPFMAAAVENGLMQGYDGYLRPQDGITRAEAATLLFRAIKQPVSTAPEEAEKPEDMPVPEATPAPPAAPEKETKPTAPGEVITITKFQQISGYRDDEIRGELRVSFAPSAPQFSADLKCYEGLGYTLCEIRLEEHTAVSANTLEGYFTVSLGGKPRHTRLKGTAQLSDDGVLTLHTEDYDYNLVALVDNYTASPLPEDTGEAETGLHSLTFSVRSTVTDTAIGAFWLTYDESNSHPTVQGEITAGGKSYKISSDSVTAFSSESATGKFTIMENGIRRSSGTEGTLTGLDAGLGGLARFRTADGTFDLSLLITEIVE